MTSPPTYQFRPIDIQSARRFEGFVGHIRGWVGQHRRGARLNLVTVDHSLRNLRAPERERLISQVMQVMHAEKRVYRESGRWHAALVAPTGDRHLEARVLELPTTRRIADHVAMGLVRGFYRSGDRLPVAALQERFPRASSMFRTEAKALRDDGLGGRSGQDIKLTIPHAWGVTLAQFIAGDLLRRARAGDLGSQPTMSTGGIELMFGIDHEVARRVFAALHHANRLQIGADGMHGFVFDAGVQGQATQVLASRSGFSPASTRTVAQVVADDLRRRRAEGEELSFLILNEEDLVARYSIEPQQVLDVARELRAPIVTQTAKDLPDR